MSRQRESFRLSAQGGYTAVEMIITMALTAIVSGAIFSSFLVLDRIQTAWENRDQARAVGVVAEEPLVRDVQAYQVTLVDSSSMSDATPKPALKLQGISNAGAPFQVSYTVKLHGGEGVLVRAVTVPGGGADSTVAVAHGVQKVTASWVSAGCPRTLAVTMSVDTIDARSRTQTKVDVSPGLRLIPRNQVCTGAIMGTVSQASGGPIAGATVTDPGGTHATSDSSGVYIMSGLAPGSHTLTATAPGHTSGTQTASVTAGITRPGVDFSLGP